LSRERVLLPGEEGAEGAREPVTAALAVLAPGLVVGAEVDGESLGDGVPLPVSVGDGDGLGDVLGDEDLLGDGLDEPVGLDDADELGAAEPGRQLRDDPGELRGAGPMPPVPDVSSAPPE
jgi:hypothetical protein